MTTLYPAKESIIAAPFVSVIVCTRDRGASIKGAIETILANAYPSFELIVIDQSSDDLTDQTVKLFRSDPRLRYFRTDTSGSGLARHIGIEVAQSDIVFMTDDDCEVPPDWLSKMVALFERCPMVGMAFCDVVAGPYDPTKGFIPISESSVDRLITNLREWCAAGGAGIGAGMGMRKSVVRAIGGFDAMLGAGGYFGSGAETDVALRMVLHGHHVYRTISTKVVHHGFRSFEQGRSLHRRYMRGVAAFYTKLVKCGYWEVLPVFLYETWRTVVGPALYYTLHLRKPPVLGRALYLLKGLLQGLRTPVDRNRELYLTSRGQVLSDMPIVLK
jgi:glycosyltransferase involved in cell wall biosynthesis